MLRLLLTEALPEPGMRRLAGRPDVAVEMLEVPTAAALAARIGDADGLVLVMERPVLDSEAVDRADRLRVACRFGAGYDNIDVAALTARGIPLVTAGDANADAVAEHALYLLLAVAKRGPARDRAVRAGAWVREFGAVELRSRTCLVVGYGQIGRRVAGLAQAFGMTVLVSDPTERDRIARDGHQPADLDGALPSADVLVVACALTAATRNLLDSSRLARLPRGAILVNVARGEVVDEDALAAALQAGRLGGAGLDVLRTEPPPRDHPFLSCDRVVLTPHTAAHVASAYDRMAVRTAERALAGLDGRLDPADVVNSDAFAVADRSAPANDAFRHAPG